MPFSKTVGGAIIKVFQDRLPPPYQDVSHLISFKAQESCGTIFAALGHRWQDFFSLLGELSVDPALRRTKL